MVEVHTGEGKIMTFNHSRGGWYYIYNFLIKCLFSMSNYLMLTAELQLAPPQSSPPWLSQLWVICIKRARVSNKVVRKYLSVSCSELGKLPHFLPTYFNSCTSQRGAGRAEIKEEPSACEEIQGEILRLL